MFAASRRFYSLKPYLGRCKREKYLIYKTHYFGVLESDPGMDLDGTRVFYMVQGFWKADPGMDLGFYIVVQGFSRWYKGFLSRPRDGPTWYKGFLDGTRVF